MSFLPAPLKSSYVFLTAPTTSLWRYCLLSVPIALIPSLLFLITTAGVVYIAGFDVARVGAPIRTVNASGVLITVIIGPLIETLMLSFMLTVLSSTSLSRFRIILIAGISWRLFHGAFGALWFFGTFWSFMVFSNSYLTWRVRSWKQAFLAALLPHMAINAITMCALFLLPK